ncbi:MAG: hypothetical protein PF961_22455 [Planctomycetota bacterium]|nr:hypothetical protein [Planctomycetota bacterium]
MEAMVNPKSGPEWDVPTLGDGKVEDPAPKPVSDTSPAEPGEWERLNHLVVVYATYKGLSTDLEEIILKAGVAIVIAKPSDAKSVVRDLLAEGFSPEAIAGAGLQVPDKR